MQYTIFDAVQSVGKLLFNVFHQTDSEYYRYLLTDQDDGKVTVQIGLIYTNKILICLV